MGFPIKKRINADMNSNTSGLDLLCAATEFTVQESRRTVPSHVEFDSASNASKTSAECSSDSSIDSSIRSRSLSNDSLINEVNCKHNCDNAGDNADDIEDTTDIQKTFPEILMEMLSNSEHSSIVSWLPHGKSFVIHKPRKFAARVLPKYFRKTRFDSFIRKLNRWGFRRIKSGSPGEHSALAHRYFCRDDPALCQKMHCNSKPTRTFSRRVSDDDIGRKRPTVQVMVPYGLSPPSDDIYEVNNDEHVSRYDPPGRSMVSSSPPPTITNTKKDSSTINMSMQFESERLLKQMQQQTRMRLQMLNMVPDLNLGITSQILAQRHMQLSKMTEQSRELLRKSKIN